jgi:hypothetical protein
MRHSRRAIVLRVGVGVGLATAVAFLGPDSGSGPAEGPARQGTYEPAAPSRGSAPEPGPAAPAPAPAPPAPETVPDPGCQTVDANGVPLFDSQYQQRTGHPPC